MTGDCGVALLARAACFTVEARMEDSRIRLLVKVSNTQ